MHLSKLIISNYRSIREISLSFDKGKNIIVGKNNAGKSNILKAIDLILGDGSPTWQKSDNITENDFFNKDTSKPIHIFCELIRDLDEILNYDEIDKCTGFKVYATRGKYEKIDGKGFYTGIPIRQTVDFSTVQNFISSINLIFDLTEEETDGKSIYINSKLKNQVSFQSQFEKIYHFAFSFRAKQLDNGSFQKEIRFLYREDNQHDWILALSAPIRNEFLQSAIIHSFRDPQNELRLNQWSWFGKLLKEFTKSESPELIEAFRELKKVSNGIFKELQDDINSTEIKVAFPDTTISFQFNPDTKIDYYKSTLIYVDDGFNSLLQDKGSGIQSAVIIGLYNYYTNNIAHTSASLLAVEEPEIYLHPQARRVISQRIDDFLQGNKNQVIITTHSTEFITSPHENLNIISIRKTNYFGTQGTNTTFSNSKEKQILTKSQNAEMFFADKVILVEGGDKYIIEAISQYYGSYLNTALGQNWLNEQNISVISVGGKSEFYKYVKKLKELSIPTYVLADFDFFLRGLNDFFIGLSYPIKVHTELNELKGKLNLKNYVIPEKLISQIDEFVNTVSKEGVKIDQKELRRTFKEPFKAKKLCHFPIELQGDIKAYLKRLEKINVFILENELEDYYTESCKSQLYKISGKEEKAIYIVSQILNNDTLISDLINCDEYLDFINHVAST